MAQGQKRTKVETTANADATGKRSKAKTVAEKSSKKAAAAEETSATNSSAKGKGKAGAAQSSTAEKPAKAGQAANSGKGGKSAESQAQAASAEKVKGKKTAADGKVVEPKKGKAASVASGASSQIREDVKPLSNQLLELHLQHELQQFQGGQFVQHLRAELSLFMEQLQHTTLNDAVTPDQVMGTIRRNVVDMKIAGGVTELAGDMASRVYTSKAHQNTKLKDIMNARQFEEFVEKVLSFKSHRQRAVSQVLSHPVYSELVSKILYQGIVQYLSKSNLSGANIPGVSAMFKFGKKMMDKAAPDLEASLESSLKAFIGKNMRFFIQQSENFLNDTLSDKALKGTIMDFWDAIENKSMKDFQKGVDTLDLSEFVVLGYEFWLKYRTTKHFESACRTVVEGIYEKYGDQPLAVLLEDMGITEAMILAEIEAFAPPVADLMIRNGYLERLLRSRLERFYHSDAVQGIL